MTVFITKTIKAKLAGNILLISLGLLAVFHLLILIGVVPANIVWGGQIGDSWTNLLLFEIIALVVTTVFAVIIATKVGYINLGKFGKTATIGVWIIFAYLILNTIGNMASGVSIESMIFAPITLLLAFCAFRLGIEK